MRRVPLGVYVGEEKDLASSFFCELHPLEDPSSFKELYDAFKKAHPKADHYPYAYVVNGASKSSDDGEPGGSAGRPLIGLLQSYGLDGVLMVARYFGGSKLGIPRLRRAFLASAEDAIKKAKIGEYVPMYLYDVELTYSEYETLRGAAERIGYRLQNEVYDVKVRAEIVSRSILDGLGEKVGLFDLTLPSPRQVDILEEVPS